MDTGYKTAGTGSFCGVFGAKCAGHHPPRMVPFSEAVLKLLLDNRIPATIEAPLIAERGHQTTQREADFPRVLGVLFDNISSDTPWPDDSLATGLMATGAGKRTLMGVLYRAVGRTHTPPASC